jgi:hypothetical protein
MQSSVRPIPEMKVAAWCVSGTDTEIVTKDATICGEASNIVDPRYRSGSEVCLDDVLDWCLSSALWTNKDFPSKSSLSSHSLVDCHDSSDHRFGRYWKTCDSCPPHIQIFSLVLADIHLKPELGNERRTGSEQAITRYSSLTYWLQRVERSWNLTYTWSIPPPLWISKLQPIRNADSELVSWRWAVLNRTILLNLETVIESQRSCGGNIESGNESNNIDGKHLLISQSSNQPTWRRASLPSRSHNGVGYSNQWNEVSFTLQIVPPRSSFEVFVPLGTLQIWKEFRTTQNVTPHKFQSNWGRFTILTNFPDIPGFLSGLNLELSVRYISTPYHNSNNLVNELLDLTVWPLRNSSFNPSRSGWQVFDVHILARLWRTEVTSFIRTIWPSLYFTVSVVWFLHVSHRASSEVRLALTVRMISS